MKKKCFVFVPVIITFCLLLLTACGNRRGSNAEGQVTSGAGHDTASIWFSEYEHDFGKVTAGETVACIFSFENRGNGPLVLSSASTSCGCTVSKYSTKPIAPGGRGTMEISFDSSGRSGRQTKTITVKSNATKPVVLLRITCEVISANNN